ncbi:hypothetical protein ACRALDRAFT_2027668 [Sodiomyces alcalophilus JCM 7366]|uniref:uncharacterized protein n=1 Tax=Sodiomyces alcalophilus JCM 7366 TaxID=591952 RepID=UPI0039B68C02
MSFLEKQKASFSSALASASGRLSTRHTPTTPTPSAGPAGARKEAMSSRRHAGSDGSDESVGTIILLMTYIHEYLRAQTEPKTARDIMKHLEDGGHVRDPSPSMCQRIVDALRSQKIVKFTPDPELTEQKWDSGTYLYLGKLGGIKDKVSLLAHLQSKSTMEPLIYKELKEGWPQCDAALLELEREHKIMILREKKGPKHIFIDDPTLHHKVEPEFQRMWQRVTLPSTEDIVKKLIAAGQKPASADPSTIKKTDSSKKVKKRANRRSAMTTNVHMQHLLKDFSHVKK